MKRFPLKAAVTACAISLAISSSSLLADTASVEASDLWAEASLTTTYTLNRHLNPFDIDVDVNKGVATLRGSVDSEVERDLAEELALGVKNIDEVDNKLRIDPSTDQATGISTGDGEGDSGRNFMQKVEDANVTAKVKSQLLWNSNTGGLNISVSTRSGKVILQGTVKSEAESQLAEQIAGNTNGVIEVDNRLQVDTSMVPPGEAAERTTDEVAQNISDSWITAKVKSVLLYNRTVDGSDINVDTTDGVVSLHGLVDSTRERERAIELAGSVKGVKLVNDVLENR